MTLASSLKCSPRPSWVTVFRARPRRWAHSGMCWASGKESHFPTSSSTTWRGTRQKKLWIFDGLSGWTNQFSSPTSRWLWTEASISRTNLDNNRKVALQAVVDGALIQLLPHHRLVAPPTHPCLLTEQRLQHGLKRVGWKSEIKKMFCYSADDEEDSPMTPVILLVWLGLMCCCRGFTEPRLTTGRPPNQNDATEPNSWCRLTRNSCRLPLLMMSWRFPSLSRQKITLLLIWWAHKHVSVLLQSLWYSNTTELCLLFTGASTK